MTIYPTGGPRIDRTALFICNHLRRQAGQNEIDTLDAIDNPDEFRLFTRDILTIYRDGCIELELAQL